MRRQLGKMHRWIFTVMGVFIVMWLISGILMAMPDYWFGPTPEYMQPVIDYHSATLSPADTVGVLISRGIPSDDIRRVDLRQVRNDLLYSVQLGTGETLLVDARSGETFEFSEELVVDIIRDTFHVDSTVVDVTRLNKHDASYPWGSLPAWKIRFAYDSSHVYLVAEKDLGVFRSSTATRVRTAITSLHEFTPVYLISDDQRVRKGLLILTGTVSLAGALIGVLLTLPRRRRAGGEKA